jgi:hypothetical protein
MSCHDNGVLLFVFFYLFYAFIYFPTFFQKPIIQTFYYLEVLIYVPFVYILLSRPAADV